MSILCPSCKNEYQREDKVVLNIAHTVIHIDCPDRQGLPYKDEGTFEEIVKKYPFFKNSLIK
jgi:hypothetical protein